MDSGIQRVNPTTSEVLKTEFSEIYGNLGNLNEVDWSKVRDMPFNESKHVRRTATETIASSHCLECPDFLEYVSHSVDALLTFSTLCSMRSTLSVRKSKSS